MPPLHLHCIWKLMSFMDNILIQDMNTWPIFNSFWAILHNEDDPCPLTSSVSWTTHRMKWKNTTKTVSTKSSKFTGSNSQTNLSAFSQINIYKANTLNQLCLIPDSWNTQVSALLRERQRDREKYSVFSTILMKYKSSLTPGNIWSMLPQSGEQAFLKILRMSSHISRTHRYIHQHINILPVTSLWKSLQFSHWLHRPP